MSTFKPKHRRGQRIGTVVIQDIGTWSRESPDGTRHLRRGQWWYQVQCRCNAPAYWISQDQARTHVECNACTQRGRRINQEAQPKRGAPPVDFLRIRLVSDEMRELMKRFERTA